MTRLTDLRQVSRGGPSAWQFSLKRNEKRPRARRGDRRGGAADPIEGVGDEAGYRRFKSAHETGRPLVALAVRS